jgi:adenosylhomocysteine nucleosidase
MSAIGLVTALHLETRAVLAALTRTRRIRPAPRPSWTGRAGAREVVVVQGGVGPDAAALAAAAVPANVVLLGSIGFAGGLDPALGPGDVVVASSIVWDDHGVACRYDVAPTLVETLLRVLRPVLPRPPGAGPLFSTSAIITGVDAKRAAHRRHAAVAVEMEAAALARHASAHGIPLFALRVVLDPAALSLEDLPPNLDSSWAARARLATTPRVWPLLGTLRRHASTAGDALTCALRASLPTLAPP